MAIIAPCVRYRVAWAAKKNEKFAWKEIDQSDIKSEKAKNHEKFVWREVERSDMKSIDGGWRSVKRFEGQCVLPQSKNKVNKKL